MNSNYSYLNDSSFLKQIDELRLKEQYLKLTILDFLENPIQEIQGKATGGSISINGNSSCRRTGNFTMIATQQDNDYPITSTNNIISINKKIKIEIGIKNTTSQYKNYDIIWFPLGIYVITSAQVTNSKESITLSMNFQDKMCLLNGSVGGILPASITFDNYDDADGNLVKPTIYMIIQELVNHYGNEQLGKIIISDVDTRVKQVMRWVGSTPVFIKYVDSQSSFTANITTDESAVDDSWTRYTYGYDIGYVFTDFTYPGDLIASPGDSVCTILDKIKSALGNYEYFYDINGNFVFQEIKNYLNTSYVTTLIDNLQQSDYAVDKQSKTVYSFNNTDLLLSIQNSPHYDNVKNDFVIWGIREDKITGIKRPIRYHLAIDEKPVDPNNPDKDFRTVLYEQGQVAEALGLNTNYYYVDLKEEWPKLFDMENNCFKDEVLNNQSGIDYFLDFIDSEEAIRELSISNIGRRTYARNESSVNCLFEPAIPELVWLNIDDPDIAEKRAECQSRNIRYCQVDSSIFDCIASGGTYNSAYQYIKDALYQYTGYNETIAIQSMPIYYLDANTRIFINDPLTSTQGDFIINSINIPLTINGVMALSCTRAVQRI